MRFDKFRLEGGFTFHGDGVTDDGAPSAFDAPVIGPGDAGEYGVNTAACA